jgi:hypothetical protein
MHRGGCISNGHSIILWKSKWHLGQHTGSIELRGGTRKAGIFLILTTKMEQTFTPFYFPFPKPCALSLTCAEASYLAAILRSKIYFQALMLLC